METEDASDMPSSEEGRVYDDAKRKSEILPPREQWPAALRPPIRGKTMVLEDHLLEGHTVRLGIMPTAEGLTRPLASTTAEEGKRGALMLFEQITPLLKKWLEENLLSMGLAGKKAAVDSNATKAGRQPNAGGKAEKPPRSRTREKPVAKATKTGQATSDPKVATWSGAVGRKANKAPPPPPPPTAEHQPPSGTEGRGPPPNPPISGEWQVVAKKKAKKKPAPAKSGATEKKEKSGPTAAHDSGQPSAKGRPGNRRVPPPLPRGPQETTARPPNVGLRGPRRSR